MIRSTLRFSILGIVLASLIALAAGGPAVARGAQAEPLNFVFIMADDLGWADLGCYGSDLHETPNIDRFASGCMRFTDAYASAPVCSPSRAALMTGKFPARLHMTIWYESSNNPPMGRKLIPPITVGNLPHEEVTVAEVLHDAGYLTAHIGKWHLGDAAHYPETQGFDVNIGGTFWGAPNTYFFPYRGSNTYREFRYVPHLEFGKPGEYLTDRLAGEAMGVIDRASAAKRPFFVYLAFHSVHTPIEGKPDYVDRYAKRITPKLHHKNAGYAAMVHSMDENVGRVLAKLDTLGLSDRTVVFLTSDNGGFINNFHGKAVTDNSPLRSGKGSLYEGGVRVPLMIHWPGVTSAGAVSHVPVATMDYYPTILEIAKLKGDPAHNANVDGMSIVPLLKDPQAKLPRERLFWHYPHYYPTTSPVSSVREGDWKLLEYLEDMHVELYNLKDDLGERRDLAAEMPERAEALRKKLHAWRESVDAQMPRPNPNPKGRAANGQPPVISREQLARLNAES